MSCNIHFAHLFSRPPTQDTQSNVSIRATAAISPTQLNTSSYSVKAVPAKTLKVTMENTRRQMSYAQTQTSARTSNQAGTNKQDWLSRERACCTCLPPSIPTSRCAHSWLASYQHSLPPCLPPFTCHEAGPVLPTQVGASPLLPQRRLTANTWITSSAVSLRLFYHLAIPPPFR